MPTKERSTSKDEATVRKATSAWPLFLAAHTALIASIEQRLRRAGLPELAWYDVLWALERSPGSRMRMHELATETVIARSNITRLVDRLAAAGLVARDRQCADRRGAYAVLTDAGRAMRRRMWSIYGPAIEELFSGRMSASESATVEQVLRRVLQAARTTPTEPPPAPARPALTRSSRGSRA